MGWTVIKVAVHEITGVANNQVVMHMPDGSSRTLTLTRGTVFVWPEEATLVLKEGKLVLTWPDGSQTSLYDATNVTLSKQASSAGQSWLTAVGSLWYLLTDKIIGHQHGPPPEPGPTSITGVRG